MPRRIIHHRSEEQIDRRGFLECMAWAGTGMIWTISGGIPSSRALGQTAPASAGDFTFIQISDTHIGFRGTANTDVNATLEAAVVKINGEPGSPAFIIHTGDLSHNAKPAEFDTMDQLLKNAAPKQIFYVPGEHDLLGDEGKQYLERYGKGTQGRGWYSFDVRGIHFVGLVNVNAREKIGNLGTEQLEWVEEDLKNQSASTPIVLFAHVPLWAVYPKWGWTTDDSAQMLNYLKRFGSVTVLNGHIHQVMQKVEGNLTFHTAMSTAFPQAQPGPAFSPGPMTVPDDRLRSLLGIAQVHYTVSNDNLAVTDSALEAASK